MSRHEAERQFPFRPGEEELKSIEKDVAELPDIQERLRANHVDLHFADRAAHQYQIAGGKVTLTVADELPPQLEGVGLFEPGALHHGVGRISTGLGTPHVETNPDFLGIMLAFQTRAGRRVDFLGINDPTSPTDNHLEFVDLLHATAHSAGASFPLVGELGELDLGNLAAEQARFFAALRSRMGFLKASGTALHVAKQTSRTALSTTAYQTYWTGVTEVGGTACKFIIAPTQDVNRRRGIRPGERHLSEEWKKRQRESDIEFVLYWIQFLNEGETPTRELTAPWKEAHRRQIGMVTFHKTDLDSEEAKLWALLTSEMGANPGNWVHDKDDSIKEPATEFGVARKIAYRVSQAGRRAIEPETYESVFRTGLIAPELARELIRRRDEKAQARHVNRAE